MGLLKTVGMQKRSTKTAMRGAASLVVAVSVATGMVGCGEYPNLRNSFFDPSQVGRFDRDTPWGIGQARPVVWPILDTLGVLDEPQTDWVNATDPTPADLVSKAEEQTLAPGDAVRVSIFELLQPGQEAVTEARIDDLGMLTVKNLGKVKVQGLTATQLEAKVSQMLVDQQILPPNPPPQVNVLLLDSQSRVFYLMGSAARPGTYTLQGNDFRLLKALALAGDIPVQAGNDFLYIIRQTPYDEKTGMQGGADNTGATAPAPTPAGGGTGDPMGALKNLDEPGTKPAATDTAPGTGPGAEGPRLIRPIPTAMSMAGPRDGTMLAQNNVDAALGMPGAATGSMPAMSMPATVASTMAGATTMQANEQFMWVDGKWVPVPATQGGVSATDAGAGTGPAGTGPAGTEDLKQTRVIRIPIKQLREGVSKYNIVIRPGDIINMPTLDLGEFYMMGNIARPGVYSLTGRKITLKQAVAAGGNLGPLAIPRRCELIRRIGPDQEAVVQVNLQKIFDGTQPDIFLKANDILNVGTDAIAPFVAVTRNAYRASYGWGFIYDKNFSSSSNNNSGG